MGRNDEAQPWNAHYLKTEWDVDRQRRQEADKQERLREYGAANGATMTVNEFARVTPDVPTALVTCEGCGNELLANPDMTMCHLCRGDAQ